MTDPESPETLAAAEEPAPVDDPTTEVREDASDAELRAWARDNGVEGVPASGKLSSAWRETIINAMAAALAADPKEEASAEATSTDSPALTEEPTPDTTETVTTDLTTDGEDSSPSTDAPNEGETPLVEEEAVEIEEEEPRDPKYDLPEFESGEYRSVFKAPSTFMTSQAYTA